MKKITRRNFLIASGKTVGTLAAALCLYGVCQPGAGGELLPPVCNARPDR